MTTPKTSAKWVADLRARRKAAGLKRIELDAHPDDVQPIRNYAEKLSKKRAKSQSSDAKNKEIA